MLLLTSIRQIPHLLHLWIVIMSLACLHGGQRVVSICVMDGGGGRTSILPGRDTAYCTKLRVAPIVPPNFASCPANHWYVVLRTWLMCWKLSAMKEFQPMHHSDNYFEIITGTKSNSYTRKTKEIFVLYTQTYTPEWILL